jgi:hypothetical protein
VLEPALVGHGSLVVHVRLHHNGGHHEDRLVVFVMKASFFAMESFIRLLGLISLDYKNDRRVYKSTIYFFSKYLIEKRAPFPVKQRQILAKRYR